MYTEITIDQFRGCLKAEKHWKEVAPEGQEIHFDFFKDGFVIRVYSSIMNGVSRDCGKDAIRVSVVCEMQDKTVGILKFPRVTRQQNWQKNLKDRVMEAYNSIGSIKRCPRCSSPMALRVAKKTKSKFYGCARYPLCGHTEAV